MEVGFKSGLVTSVVLSVIFTTSLAIAGPVVVAPHSTVAGKTIGEWTAEWWNWAGRATPSVTADTTGAAATSGQSGPVFFIAGTAGGSATRTFNVPSDKYLLFPLINWIVANGADPGYASTAEEATALVEGTVDPSKLFATIDGVAVPDLASHREAAPLNFTLVVKPDSFGFPPGTYTDANADGYFVMLQPLGAGQHTLHFGGTTKDFVQPAPSPKIDSFTIDTTAHVSAGGTAIPLPPGVLGGMPMLLAALGGVVWRKAR